MKNKVILFDIDYTLFDVAKYKSSVFSSLEKLLPHVSHVQDIAQQSYDEIREKGPFNPEMFTAQLLRHLPTQENKELLMGLWEDKELLVGCLYTEARPVLEKISSDLDAEFGIFSSGLTYFQKLKIEVIAEFFSREHIHIHEIKDSMLPEILAGYKGKKVILIDDYLEVLEKAKVIDPSVVTVWVKRGKFAEKASKSMKFFPDFTIHTLTELLPLLTQFDK